MGCAVSFHNLKISTTTNQFKMVFNMKVWSDIFILFFKILLILKFGSLCYAQQFNKDEVGKALNGSVNASTSAAFIFGIPPIPIDKAIPGVREDDDFENWVAPYEYRKKYVNYLSGFDKHNHPIWICEWGKYDLRYVVDGGKKAKAIFEKYQRQSAYVAKKSQLLKSTNENPVTQHIVIIDFEGLRAEAVSNAQVINYMVAIQRKYRQFFEKNIYKIIAINVNFVAEIVINLVRPIFGRLLRRIEVYGTNRAKIIPILNRRLPQDQLPAWLGGNKDHKPVFVMG